MKLSQKFKETIKKNLTIAIVICALISSTLATFKLADFSMNSSNTIYTTTLAETSNEENTLATTRLENTDTITYIYDAADLVAFRNVVNAGDNYSGKTVYLMDDIDLSTVCSSTLGSWTPIGASGTYFAGTFNGNYHTINNLYINSNSYANAGLFSQTTTTTIIQNLLMENINIYNSCVTTGTNTGGIVGLQYGVIQNVGIKSGSVSANTSSASNIMAATAGISGRGKAGAKIYNCYNKASVTATAKTSGSSYTYAAGVIGYAAHIENGEIINCYNRGAIKATGAQSNAGGVIAYVSRQSTSVKITLKNLYNTGTATATAGTKKPGGIIGANGYSSTLKAVGLTNSYCTTATTYTYSGVSTSTAGRVAPATLQTYTVKLGNSYVYDVYNQNEGYPVLAWENIRPVMELNKKQEYIKVGEKLQLNVVEKDEITEKIGTNYSATNFKWISTNEDVATVDSKGLVTGISDGYTTIYAYHQTSGLYAMCVVNVAKDFANPQIETGNGFTTILKSDGTVWTIGNNASGQLGNGENQNSKVPVKVKQDEDTDLENIVKIAVGTDHVLALAKNGKVYSWGLNTYGQLGINNTNSSNYAKTVLGLDGASYLSNIVDISAGAYGSMALDKNGNVYVWGNGTDGEIGNNATSSINLPLKTTIEDGIQVSIGDGQVGVLTSDGVVWSWGRNSSGQLGINCTGTSNNTSYPMKTALNVTELSIGGYHSTTKKIDETLYAAGSFQNGRLGTGSTANATTYVEVNLPSTITESNKVKYIKSGITNTTLLLTDGTVWETGFNLNGELGNGTTTTSESFVQGLTKDGDIQNVLIVGKNNGNINGSETTGWGLNTAVITTNGDIYTTGDNSYGQIGNNTTTSISYYTRMGFAYLDYADKTVEIDDTGYQIDLNKLKYVYSSINAYGNEQTYSLGEIKFTSLNETIATVDETGKVMGKDGVSGITQIKIEDITNGYETKLTVVVNKLENTDTVTYIYSADDMVKFRDEVNSGDNFVGKSVYVMADIDMSSVCSENMGSFTPIGATGTYFAGTFDGNFHSISNLYINSGSYVNLGLFTQTTDTTVIQNLIMKNINIYNSCTSSGTNTGGIVGIQYGVIQNVGISSGNISANTSANSGIMAAVGGITGRAKTNTKMLNCYNKADITTTTKISSNGAYAYAGGIVGYAAHMNGEEIINCYNRGNIKATGIQSNAGGVIGYVARESSSVKITLKNLYNTGTATATAGNKEPGGIIGANGYSSTLKPVTLTNSYCTTATTYTYSGVSSSTAGRVLENTLKTYATTLGNAYENDDFNLNEGYPILWWEAPTIELNKKQEYIQVGEQLQLTIIQNDIATSIFGEEVKTTHFVWNSSNKDIATVDSNGLITGVSDGYTTIYGYNETYNLYTMCTINVAKSIANPQAETGNGFTAILKADGTVWTIGKNDNGQLGDGTNEEKIEVVQVKIDENTYLTNIVKISVGSNHVLALTKDGKVYSWGSNEYGQLGQNNTENLNYAKLVLGEGGSSSLERIIDISAGTYGSTAINQFGWTFVWGNGSYGEMGNGTTTANTTPSKTTLNTAISASMGAGHVAAIGQNGAGYTWGRNSYGELGVGNTTNATSVTKVLEGIIEVSSAGFETIVKNIDGTVSASGLNTSGQLATGTTTNVKLFTTITLPDTVINENKVKYIKAGTTSSTLQLTDGTVWTVGNNVNGELGNNTNTNSSTFTQAQAKNGNLESTLILGRSSGLDTSLNTVAINESGRVYTTGSNTYGQIGNNTKDDVNYFTEMGYIEVLYPEKITMKVSDTKILTGDDFAYVEKYFNVYQKDETKVPLLADTRILDSSIATYEEGTITANKVGKTTLMVKEDSTETIIYIPVEVLPENGVVVPDVKTGQNFTIALKSNGSVWSFGINEYGELGVGDNVYKNIPTQVEILANNEEETDDIGTVNNIIVEQISVGNSHVIALTQDGEVYTWGLNSNGQLGVGNTTNSNIPQKVELPESTELVQVIKDTPIKVIANKNVSYIILQNGKVYAFGEGYGTTPVLVELGYDIIDISNSYMVDINGNVYDLATKTRLEIVEKIKYISEGDTHTVFLSEEKTAYAIGSNTFGQFGDGTNVSNNTQVVAIRNKDLTDVLRNIEKIETGNSYTVAVLETGETVEFGSNQYGQLGTDEIGETNTIRENTFVTSLLNETNESIILMDAGNAHVAIALSDGNVYTWGLGTDGQLGNSTNNSNIQVQLVGKNIVEANTNNLLLNVNEVFDLNANTTYFNLIEDVDNEISYESKDETVVKVDSATGEVIAIAQGKTVIVAREIGTENISVVQVRVLPEGIEIEPQVSTNGSHTVTLKVDGTVWCYGNNTNGELGNGTTKYSDQPVQAIFPEGTIIVQVDAGEDFSVALDSEGNVWTWGANDYYQLGNIPSTYLVGVPTKVEGLSNITKISAGTYSVIALNSNKEVYGWGLNSNGELGIGSYTNKVKTPTIAKYMTDVIDIAVGKNHSIALKSTGEVFVTGLNLYGQLGNDNTSTKKVNLFTKVEGLSGVARISATDSANIVSTVNGKVYNWGLNIYGELGLGDKINRTSPVLVNGIENIVEVSGGKNHSLLLDKSGKVYSTGSNKLGQLGLGTTTEQLNYQLIDSLSNVMTISAGNTYSAIAKEDGTVWGFGDYNHGDTSLKSKTKSLVPMQVGNDAFGLGVTEITIKKSETVNITSSMVYSFNLIHLNQNNTEEITYESINEEIAIVNEYGEVLGVREGFTWVKVIEQDGTEHVVYVYVTDNESEYAPKIQAGEDFASVLKSDGTNWTFGHNNNGELGIGSNRTKDIPEKTNVISSYRQIKTGNGFTIAIRNDGTVWSYGENNYGQLGLGNTRNGLNPVQVNGITEIVQIAAGKEHSLAMDSYGILYGWGRNKEGQLGLENEVILTPTVISYAGGTISSIWAGENQTVIINTKGKVYGFGSLLNGELAGIDNAVKVSVGKGYMLILTTDGEVFKYNGNSLTKYTELANIVDIDVKNENIIAQTVDEKIYTFTASTNLVLEDMENIYTMAAGVNNSYVIKTDGTVYARGINGFGQLGNSTRVDSLTEFTLVGNRQFSVEPESKIMYVNDVEQLTEDIVLNEFNAFNRSIRNGEEYTWVSSDAGVVSVNNGELTALAEGTAQITVTDTITNTPVTVTRVVIPVEKDRIQSIKVNDNEAGIQEEYKYYVEVETKEDTATLSVQTKDATDKISIDQGANWFENGTLTSQIDIPNEENEFTIIVETSNGTQITYTLKVKKISTDVSLENITVDGITATPISSTNYEVVVPEDTTISEIIARANSQKALVSINGEQFITWKSITTVDYENKLAIVVPIVVQAENGDELEYLLTIYKESAVLQLESLTVEGNEAVKTSENVYSAIVERNLLDADIIAKAVSELVNVSLNSEDAQVQISTTEVLLKEETTQVTIRLSTTVDGIEVYKDYILNIYKKAETGKIQFVIVNGTVIMPNVDGTYEAYLPGETQKATVKVIAQNELDYVQIETNEKEQGSSEVEVTTPEASNEYSIIVSDEDLSTSERYTLYIKKPSADATIKEITVVNGDDVVTASKSAEEENVYIAKVKAYDNYDAKVTTNNINAYVSIDGETKVRNITSKVITRTSDYMELAITVESEDGDIEEYTLKIYVMSSDATLEFIKINIGGDNIGTEETESIMAVLQPDGSYLANLVTAETEVSVTAQTTSQTANVKIENEEYELHTTTRDVTIDSKETIQYIYVKAEDGTTEKYKLVITGLPDDSTLQKVTVNGNEARYIEGENKYEIRSTETEFNIEAIATDSLAKLYLNEGEENIGTGTITVQKEDVVQDGILATVTIKVLAQNGIETTTYTLEIKEKSSDASISNITVNDVPATKNQDGNYTANVAKNVENAVIKVQANDTYSTVYLDNETQNSSNITVEKEITQRETIYTIKVIAEDGTEEIHTLTITRLENNVNLQELTVTLQVENTTEVLDEETGEVTEEITIEEKTYTPELLEDGTYYLKIDRVEEVDVKAILQDANAQVKIKNSAYELAQNEETVDTVAEKTQVIISVKAEDGTVKDYTLMLEKKSNDTSLLSISSIDILKTEEYTLYVDESLEQTNLTLITNNNLAFIKLDTDENYTAKQITRTIDLSEAARDTENELGGWTVNVQVQAEDGTVQEHVITILKTGNTNINTVKVNTETIEQIENTYTARVKVAQTANVEITTQNENAKIEIIEITVADDETQTEMVIGTGTGTLAIDVPLNENPQNYTIRITSASGSSISDYSLVLEQKSTDTSLSYVKVDGITAIDTTDGYKSVVSGKETYPVVIKATDEKAQIKILYNDYESNYMYGKFEENVPVQEGETLEVTIRVQSENEDIQDYKLYITRISNNTALEYVKVNGENCTNFDADTNTYSIIVDNSLTNADIDVKALSEVANVTVGTVSSVQIVNTSTVLTGQGTTKTVTIKVDAEDGTTKYYYLNIIQLSASISLDTITVNGEVASKVTGTNYEVTISNKDGIAKIIANAQEEASTVSIAGDVATVQTATKTYTLNGCETITTTILVTAEDGVTQQEYNLTIYVQDSNNNLEYVKVDGFAVTDFNAETNTYKTIVDNSLQSSIVEVKTVSDIAKITIGDQTETNLLTKTVSLNGPGETTTTTISVTAEDGGVKEYTLEIYQLSNDTSLDKITVNGETANLNEESGVYEIEITDEVTSAEIIAIAGVATSEVSISEETANVGSSSKTISINGYEVIETKVTITAEDGTSKDYSLKITVLENSSKTSYVKVNTGTVEPEEDGITYKTFIAFDAVSADVEIKAESDYADIDILNRGELSISNEVIGSGGNESLSEETGSNENATSGLLKFTVETPENATTINYSITSQTGEVQYYTIILTKISTDNTLKELYVGEQLIQVSEDGNYYADLENPAEVTVKAIANNEYANIRIDYQPEEKQQTEALIDAQEAETKVTITITSQSGVTTRYYLYIRVLLNNTLLDKVVVDGVDAKNTEGSTEYISLIDNTKNDYEVFLMAMNDVAIVELFDGEDLVASGVGNLTEIVTLAENEAGYEYNVKVSLDEEHYSNYTLKLLRSSNDTSLKLVEVNDVARSSLPTDKYVYEVGIQKLAETAKIRVQTTNSYATVRIGDHEEVTGGDTVTVNLSLLESRTTVPVVVTAVDGTTIDTFNILLIRQSNIATLESVVVNDTVVENVDDVYTYYMSEDEYTAHAEITMPLENNGKIQIDDSEGIGYLEYDVDFEADTIKVEKIIKVTSEDGTVEKEYTLVLVKKTQIIGSILTKNFEGKYLSNIELYRIEDTTVTDEVDMSNSEQVEQILHNLETVESITTNEDGTYELDIEQTGNYIIKATKPGYLSYLVTNIEIMPGRIVDLGAYELIAGDIVPSGEIEIDDLVTINENYGVVITEENMESVGSFDLNEDGTIDALDRNILKANYGKLAECVEWINPNAVALMTLETDETLGKQSTQENQTQDFILPMSCSYVITSSYGSRIDPITNEQSFHCGIDISGIHHTEILSVADGEVTFAGVKNSYGNCIEIKHNINGETVYSFYAHLSQINVQTGETVKQGQIIGLEGGASTDPNPGDSTGHHLHFEIRKASGYGNDVDPSLYIEF